MDKSVASRQTYGTKSGRSGGNEYGRQLVDVTSNARSTHLSSVHRRRRERANTKRAENTVGLGAFGCVAFAVLIAALVLVGFVIYNQARIVDSERRIANTRREAVAIRQNIECAAAVNSELQWQVFDQLHSGPGSAAGLSDAFVESGQSCGAALLGASPELFRPTMTTLGNLRRLADSMPSPAYVAGNYTGEISRRLLNAILASMGRLDRWTVPSVADAQPLVILVRLQAELVELVLLHSIGTLRPGAQQLAASTSRRISARLAALSQMPGRVGTVVQSQAMRVCLSALRRPLESRGSSLGIAACTTIGFDMTEAALASVDAIAASIEERHNEVSEWRVPYLVVGIASLLAGIAGVVIVYIARRESTEDLEKEIEMRREITESVQAFVPAQFLVILGLRVITEISIDEPQQVDVTILASDIRQFTSISELMSDVELFAWLQEHLANMTAATRRAGGFVEKFIGDAVLAIFEEPGDAVRCAIDMQYGVAEANVSRVTRGEDHMVRVGVGVHGGPTLVGILGDTSTQNTAVVGRAVDIATKLEELTKVYGAKVIVSESTFEAAGLDLPDHRKLGDCKVDGEVVRLVEIYTTEAAEIREYKTKTRKEFEGAVLARDRGNIKQANSLFDSVLSAPRPLGYEDLAAVKVIEL